MFNEAFWFFYIVGLIESLTFVFIASILGSAFALVMSGMVIEQSYYGEELTQKFKTWLKYLKAAIIGVVIIGLITFFAPSEKAMYAGAGQYIIEISETDDSLMSLKRIIDKKIEELETPKEAE